MGGTETCFPLEMSNIKKKENQAPGLHIAMAYCSNLQMFDLTHRIVATTSIVLSLSFS